MRTFTWSNAQLMKHFNWLKFCWVSFIHQWKKYSFILRNYFVLEWSNVPLIKHSTDKTFFSTSHQNCHQKKQLDKKNNCCLRDCLDYAQGRFLYLLRKCHENVPWKIYMGQFWSRMPLTVRKTMCASRHTLTECCLFNVLNRNRIY